MFSHPFPEEKPPRDGKYLVFGSNERGNKTWFISIFSKGYFSLPEGCKVSHWYNLPEDYELKVVLPKKDGFYLVHFEDENNWSKWTISIFSGKKFIVFGKVIGWLPLPPEPPL